jgi:hypothetical protein
MDEEKVVAVKCQCWQVTLVFKSMLLHHCREHDMESPIMRWKSEANERKHKENPVCMMTFPRCEGH